MKTIKLSIIALVAIIAVYSCKKDLGATSAASTVTADQAADLAAGSLASNSNGLTTVTDDISLNASGLASVNNGLTIDAAGSNNILKQACGTTLADSTTNQGSADSVTWSYFKKYSRTLNCNTSEKPDNIINRVTFSGNYSGPNVTSADAGTANVTIGHLETDSTTFLVSGEYKRSGSFTSKIGNKASGSKNVDIVVSNLVISKSGRKILSGNATINISVTTPKGTFTYTGTLTFNGNGGAVLVINGNTYTIDLHTGFRIKH